MRRVLCKACHIPGAEEPDEIRVVGKRTNSLGENEVRLQCEKCGHQWYTLEREQHRYLPGYKQAPVTVAENMDRGLWYK